MYSLNEVEALSKRAARGAGMPWGLAEEAGKATRCLTAWGLLGPETLVALLHRLDTVPYPDAWPRSDVGTWQAVCGWLCPVAAGAAMSDRAGLLTAGNVLTLGVVASPVLLAPFASMAARRAGTAVHLSWAGTSCVLLADGTAIWDGPLNAGLVDGVTVERARADPGAPSAEPVRAATDPGAWQTLVDFGHRTLAPNTAASRAGAGPA